MEEKEETKQGQLAVLEKQLADLKAALPEHCHGTEGYIGVHPASPEHLEKIEELEEEIKSLKTR